MRKTFLLALSLAAATFAFLLSRPSPSQELDAGPVDVELFDDGEDAGDEDAGFDDEDGGFDDLIDAGFDPFVDAGPDPIPLPEDDDEPAPPDGFTPPVQPDVEPR